MTQKHLTILTALACCVCTAAFSSAQRAKNKHVYAVILAGGKGERLWPLSREEKPKQFLEFADHKTLLEHTVARINSLVPAQHRWVITNKAYEANVQDMLGNSIGAIISEPTQRNTGPALLLATLQVAQQDPDATILFLPADHAIKEKNKFCQGLHTALEFVADHDVVALIGLHPTYPATGYGYIEYKEPSQSELYKVVRFHEKPPLELAKEYVAAGNMLWNGGYFCGKVATFLALFQEHTPLLYEQAQGYVNGTVAYSELSDISFDHAVMEHAKNAYVLPLEITWSDIGNLKTFLSSLEAYQDKLDNVIAINANNNLIHNEGKFTALIGVDDLCIINTDDVLLVAHQKEVERVKEILAQLQEEGKNELRSALYKCQE